MCMHLELPSCLFCSGCSCSATLYDHPHFGGRSLYILQQNAKFGNDWFDNRVESALISGDCEWILYQHHDFNRHGYPHNGNTHLVRPGHYNSATSWGGPGNQLTSARALPPRGTIAIVLFEHSTYTGRMTVLYSSTHSLSWMEFSNAASSAIVIGGTWRIYVDSSYQIHKLPNVRT